MTSYYNEFDPFAAAWLRELIKAGLIAPGDVDERSIVDVRPTDLVGYTQCHFFAGIGGWSYALRLAGCPDERPVWTGSCPCQPFSAAGKQAGTRDERHLWPEFRRLIRECHPDAVFGEQVAAAIGLDWLDHVSADLEAEGYAVGSIVLGAHSVGAPHIRQRLYFVADRNAAGCGLEPSAGLLDGQRKAYRDDADGCGESGELAESLRAASERRTGGVLGAQAPVSGARLEDGYQPDGLADGGEAGELADADRTGAARLGANGGAPQGEERVRSRFAAGGELGDTKRAGLAQQRSERRTPREAGELGNTDDTGPQGWWIGRDGTDQRPAGTTGLAGFWREADWLPCRDGKARPVEPIPLTVVDGVSESLGRMCDSSAVAAQEEIEAYAKKTGLDIREALHDLWVSLAAETLEQRHVGRQDGVFQAPILLAFLRQLSDQGWSIAQGISRASAETAEARMRGMRIDLSSTCAPYQRGLAGQQAGEYPDALRVLSSILARHAQAAWGEAFNTYAKDNFVLGNGIPARVGRLRGYGNAIVPQVAAEVIKAFMEHRT